MLVKRPGLLVMIGLGGIAVAACTDGYGYGGVGMGYGGGYYDAAPYYGWYGDYYYPGAGIYVYDRDRRPYRWNDGQRRYWQGRGGGWRGPRSPDGNWQGFDHHGPGPGPGPGVGPGGERPGYLNPPPGGQIRNGGGHRPRGNRPPRPPRRD